MLKELVQRLFMSLGIVFMLGIMISQEFRVGLADAVSPLFDPIYQTLPIHAVIFVLAIITALYSSLIQRYTIDFKRFKEIQKKVMSFQKEYMEAVKKKNKFKLKKLESQRKEMQRMQGEMMSMQFKPMFYTAVVTIPIFMWLWIKTYNNLVVKVPFSGEIHVGDPILIVPWWIFWYLLCSIAISQIVKNVFKLGL